MSTCVAPPSRPDPLRSRLHPVRDLGPAASSPDSPGHVEEQERRWSDQELKAAHTLVSGFLHQPPRRRGRTPPVPSPDLPLTLSDPERDAVDVLLTLWDTVASDSLL